jgi:hypothetical protein
MSTWLTSGVFADDGVCEATARLADPKTRCIKCQNRIFEVDEAGSIVCIKSMVFGFALVVACAPEMFGDVE